MSVLTASSGVSPMAGDAATLRAAAAVVEVQAVTRPHLMGLVNRLLALAAQLAPDRPVTEWRPADE